MRVSKVSLENNGIHLTGRAELEEGESFQNTVMEREIGEISRMNLLWAT